MRDTSPGGRCAHGDARGRVPPHAPTYASRATVKPRRAGYRSVASLRPRLRGLSFLRVPLVLVNDPRRDDLPDLGLRSQCTWVRRGHDLLPTMDIDREVSHLKASDE